MYVLCTGGPLDGWWYRQADWTVARQAAVNMNRHAGQPQGYVLGYQDSGRERRHPNDKKPYIGQVWVWRPRNPSPSAQKRA